MKNRGWKVSISNNCHCPFNNWKITMRGSRGVLSFKFKTLVNGKGCFDPRLQKGHQPSSESQDNKWLGMRLLILTLKCKIPLANWSRNCIRMEDEWRRE